MTESSNDLSILEDRLDSVTVDLLLELRTSKTVDAAAMTELLDVGAGLKSALDGHPLVPRSLTGKLWFVFTSMLTEAEHCNDPDPILDAAWSFQDQLHEIFGPKFP